MTKRKIITPEMEKDIIIKHFKKGISQTQLAVEYGVSRQTINRYYCKPYGNSPISNYILDDKEIIRLYKEEKKSVLQISKIFNTTPRPITKRLRLAGIVKKTSKREEWSKTISHYYLRLKIWTAKVIEADDMLCKDCGCENTFKNRLQAHHIIPVRDIEDPELLFDINNGITLCMKCHYKIHYHEKEHETRFQNLIKTRSSV